MRTIEHPLSPKDARDVVLRLAREARTRPQALELAEQMYASACAITLPYSADVGIVERCRLEGRKDAECAYWHGAWEVLMWTLSNAQWQRLRMKAVP